MDEKGTDDRILKKIQGCVYSVHGWVGIGVASAREYKKAEDRSLSLDTQWKKMVSLRECKLRTFYFTWVSAADGINGYNILITPGSARTHAVRPTSTTYVHKRMTISLYCGADQ